MSQTVEQAAQALRQAIEQRDIAKKAQEDAELALDQANDALQAAAKAVHTARHELCAAAGDVDTRPPRS